MLGDSSDTVAAVCRILHVSFWSRIWRRIEGRSTTAGTTTAPHRTESDAEVRKHSLTDTSSNNNQSSMEQNELSTTAVEEPEVPRHEKRWFLTQVQPHIATLSFGLQVCVEPWTYVNVYVDGTGLPDADKAALLKDPTQAIEAVLVACRHKFAPSIPQFFHVVQAKLFSSCSVMVEEVLVPDIIAQLPTGHDILAERNEVVPPLAIVSLNELSTQNTNGHFLPAGVRMVRYKGVDYAAKGPIYASQVKDFVAEFQRLAALCAWCHPHIVPGPEALISVSTEDNRVCGFLTAFYRHGNLDVYCRQRHASGDLDLRDILKWLRQLADALSFLQGQGTWHGDIKPDNLLVTDAGDIQLTDFTKILGTSVTASPEVRRHCKGRNDPNSVMLGLPIEWSMADAIASEVYSIGRTMFLVMTAQSMIEIYRLYGWVCDDPFPTDFNRRQNCTAQEPRFASAVNATKELILNCVREVPSRRPSLPSLIASVSALEEEWQDESIKLWAAGGSLTNGVQL